MVSSKPVNTRKNEKEYLKPMNSSTLPAMEKECNILELKTSHRKRGGGEEERRRGGADEEKKMKKQQMGERSRKSQFLKR